MKKGLLAILLASSLTSVASAEWLFGIDYTAYSGMTQKNEGTGVFGSSDNDFSYNPITFKVGLGTPGSEYMYVYYHSEKYDYSKGGKSLEPVTEIGYDYVGQYETSVRGLYPNIGFGVLYGSQKVDYIADQDSRYEIGLKLSAGVSYYVIPQVEILAAINYQYKLWQDLEAYGYASSFETSTISTRDSGFNAVIGVNFWPFATTQSDTLSYDEAVEADGIY